MLLGTKQPRVPVCHSACLFGVFAERGADGARTCPAPVVSVPAAGEVSLSPRTGLGHGSPLVTTCL